MLEKSKKAKDSKGIYRKSSISKFILIESKTNSDAPAHGNAAGIFDCLTFLVGLLIVFNFRKRWRESHKIGKGG